ncbi:hypothetical protein D3C87_2184080 [compost metagenome]
MISPIEDLDLENATDIFVEIFPDARLLEVLEHAERAERNLTAWGKRETRRS